MVAGARPCGGFTYLAILFVVAILGGGLALASEVWHTSVRREKETDLLYVGSELRKAIERYYFAGPKQYPRELQHLVKDPRQPGTLRHLRRIYPDPVTGTPDWGLVAAPDGGIAGVYSLSPEPPLKSGGFRLRDQGFEKAATYADWKFVFTPQTRKPAAR